jgi:hypothetical protein
MTGSTKFWMTEQRQAEILRLHCAKAWMLIISAEGVFV